MSSQERRFRRVRVEGEAVVVMHDGRVLQGPLRDIGLGGFSVELSSRAVTGTRCTALIRAFAALEIRLDATVLRAAPDHIVFEISTMEPLAHERLVELVASRVRGLGRRRRSHRVRTPSSATGSGLPTLPDRSGVPARPLPPGAPGAPRPGGAAARPLLPKPTTG